MHTPNKPNPRKINPTQKQPDTAHCRQFVKQTAQRAEKVVEHTVPDKNRIEALNAMRPTRWETKDKQEVQRATRDETRALRTGSRASSARRNGNGTGEKSSEQCAAERKLDGREIERKTRNATKRDGGERTGGNEIGKNYVSRPQQKLNQTT